MDTHFPSIPQGVLMISTNPFAITKAVDYTDSEIAQNFVSFANLAGMPSIIANPTSPMPIFLVGGKGGGRTHLMRKLSYPLQKMDAYDGIISKVRKDGYIGIYFRCSGLNASRFSGKGIATSTWNTVFAYYMDLWLSQLTLETLADISRNAERRWSQEEISAFARFFLDHFDEPPAVVDSAIFSSIDDIKALITTLIRELDRSINNVALRARFEPVIRASPGRLIFGLAKSIVSELPGLDGLNVTLLVDEFENLSLEQQRYLNTLIREKEFPANFIVGSRQWGLRTFETLSAGEANRKGSEYELTVMEDAYAANKKTFKLFCEDVVLKRLSDAGIARDRKSISGLLGSAGPDRFCDNDALSIVGQSSSAERRHIARLRESVYAATTNERLAADIATQLQFHEHPVLEKLAVLKFYQLWNKVGSPSMGSAKTAYSLVASLLTDTPAKEAVVLLGHWKLDMLAQLYVENDRKLPYSGFDQFVEMSGYLPRNLLVILKGITRWSLFLGESPFVTGGSMSVKAQTEGAREAAAWFARDAQPVGDLGRHVDAAIRKLGGLLRRMRYSDKPVEVSCVTFSTDRHGLSKEAERCLDACVQHGLLLEIRDGQPDRNSGSLQHKYQLNPMLAPLYDLPTARRGTFALTGDELRGIFDPTVNHSDFDRIISGRVDRMNAPFIEVMENQEVLF